MQRPERRLKLTTDNDAAIVGFLSAVVCPPVGLIYSIIGLMAVKKRAAGHKAFAQAGLIVSVLTLCAMIYWAIQIRAALDTLPAWA